MRKKELEKRIAALEDRFENGKALLGEYVDSFQEVLLDFADQYGIETDVVKELRQKESRS